MRRAGALEDQSRSSRRRDSGSIEQRWSPGPAATRAPRSARRRDVAMQHRRAGPQAPAGPRVLAQVDRQHLPPRGGPSRRREAARARRVDEQDRAARRAGQIPTRSTIMCITCPPRGAVTVVRDVEQGPTNALSDAGSSALGARRGFLAPAPTRSAAGRRSTRRERTKAHAAYLAEAIAVPERRRDAPHPRSPPWNQAARLRSRARRRRGVRAQAPSARPERPRRPAERAVRRRADSRRSATSVGRCIGEEHCRITAATSGTGIAGPRQRRGEAKTAIRPRGENAQPDLMNSQRLTRPLELARTARIRPARGRGRIWKAGRRQVAP